MDLPYKDSWMGWDGVDGNVEVNCEEVTFSSIMDSWSSLYCFYFLHECVNAINSILFISLCTSFIIEFYLIKSFYWANFYSVKVMDWYLHVRKVSFNGFICHIDTQLRLTLILMSWMFWVFISYCKSHFYYLDWFI